ncbi:high nitrogen upregulated cytochrome P450 monooxygenase 2 [Polyporus arcularius HHB13444]|uniref:High nitrogen upregulated cytochrome P450 monooxygenase 2 n=1 Tax=Polyporus arcularius HHB13444 TaxID=1314778 RepID=A0A5C3NRU3_9APHY|nr:high nitrogen upregulated cytochrome P450 monooxygenase 2 [Polyporus arcularius HHB13444]
MDLDVYVWSPKRQTAVYAMVLGIMAHQVFRQHETYRISIHFTLLLTPPLLVAVTVSSTSQSTLEKALLDSYAAYLSALVLSVVAYRLSPSHPLACYPGPISLRLSKLWMAFISRSGYQHLYYKDLHERYGNVVRIGPNELSIREPSAVMALVGPSGLPKGPHVTGRLLTDKDLPMIGIEDISSHMTRRRAWNRGFSSAAIAEYEELVGRRAMQLVQRLEAHQGRQVDLERWFDYFSYDAMYDITFGGGSELLRDGDENNVWSVLSEGMTAMTFFGHVPWLGVYFGFLPAATRPIKSLLAACKGLVKQRMQRGSRTRDLFHYLNHEDQKDKAPPPMRQLVDDGILAIVGGADTVSGALTSVLFCLLTHPEAYEKLQTEIDEYYPRGDNVLSTRCHRDMKYLEAVINETLRVYSPGLGGSQRKVPADGPGVTVGSLYIPPGTALWVHAFSLHRDPNNFFPFPDDFWPERWLFASHSSDPLSPEAADAKPADFVHNEEAYMPFSHGPMNCVGKNFALMEMRIVICALVQRFRFRLREGYDRADYDRNFKDYLIASRPNLPVIVELRG